MTVPTTALRRPSGEVVVPAVAAVAWLGVAAMLYADLTVVGVLVALLLVAVAATAVAVVGFVRRRSSGRPSGALVAAMLSPAIALAAMTPVFAVAGPVVFAVFGLVAAVGNAVLVVVTARAPHHA